MIDELKQRSSHGRSRGAKGRAQRTLSKKLSRGGDFMVPYDPDKAEAQKKAAEERDGVLPSENPGAENPLQKGINSLKGSFTDLMKLASSVGSSESLDKEGPATPTKGVSPLRAKALSRSPTAKSPGSAQSPGSPMLDMLNNMAKSTSDLLSPSPAPVKEVPATPTKGISPLRANAVSRSPSAKSPGSAQSPGSPVLDMLNNMAKSTSDLLSEGVHAVEVAAVTAAESSQKALGAVGGELSKTGKAMMPMMKPPSIGSTLDGLLPGASARARQLVEEDEAKAEAKRLEAEAVQGKLDGAMLVAWQAKAGFGAYDFTLALCAVLAIAALAFLAAFPELIEQWRTQWHAITSIPA